MVDKKVIVILTIVIVTLVVAAVVVPTSIILTRNKDDGNEVVPTSSSEEHNSTSSSEAGNHSSSSEDVGGSSSDNTPTQTPTQTPTLKPVNIVSNQVSKIRYVQTHVIPAEGLSWTLPKRNASLHLVGVRDTMILVDYSGTVSGVPQIQIYAKGASTASVTLTLDPPNKLPPTESNGTAYSTTSYSVKIAAKYIVPFMKVVVSTHSTGTSLPDVGQDSTMRLQILPFYMFGANDTNTEPYSKIKLPDLDTQKAIYQTWPISVLSSSTHPIGKISYPFAIIPASDGGQAYRITSSDQMRSGYVMMSWVLSLLSGIRSTNGESDTNNMIYSPLLALNDKHEYSDVGGGLGGGWRGTGDTTYRGIFIHEAGHSWGLPHSGEAYADQKYPYVNGSLLGSQWGFDFDFNQFLDIYIPPTAESYSGCKKYAVMNNGKCVKQDAMQGGSGDQSDYLRYATFPDFDMAIMQENMEGITVDMGNGEHISNGLLSYNAASKYYQQWDKIEKKYMEYIIKNGSDNGLYGTIDAGLAYQLNVDVNLVVIQLNYAANSTCTTCSSIYPPIKYKGNFRRYIDPRDPAQLALIVPNSGEFAWFCHSSGCDFTLRVTFSDNSQFVKLLPTGVRSWWSPKGPVAIEYNDPNNSDSMLLFVENVPGTKKISKIELLSTPLGFNGLPSNPQVLLSQTY
ncbi:hypothetical protein PPL_00912 [Heterostelium album PN500]|uniref:Peptidase M66 domain-containing protein n=1 Tax=Heterostelium pallidum (strain ATCC 26659 / Pp 5 / PN500) TaxID=670386 RepID=D3AYZ3_HETP5|nr:hypothetical protein PPL_00912 [Heterostelium album PN500]EFA85683.1 hypothetical protein PPL_00912 [Heterostelium album PN500]|eukprot:XP_020437790.1 hypothetical protein PPL_00912 [Heterostelium album PN500]